jgi:hypothetical protein
MGSPARPEIGHVGEVGGLVRFDNADECMDGVALTLSYLRVGIDGAGYTFNLRERELEKLLEAPPPKPPPRCCGGMARRGRCSSRAHPSPFRNET